MSARRAAVAALLLAPAFAGCAGTRADGSEDDRAPDPAAVHAVLDDFHDAASAADFGRYFGHFAREGVFLGTDATERWTVAEFQAYARPFFERGRGWTYRPRDRSVVFSADGRTAFFDELLDNEGLGETRGSGALVRQGGAWKIAQYNLSIPVPNALADSVVGIIRGR